MKQDEAEKLASVVADLVVIRRRAGETTKFTDDVVRLCDHILSGDMKREIENAVYERAMRAVRKCKAHDGESEIIHDCVEAIHSLIQLPAQQKENGE